MDVLCCEIAQTLLVNLNLMITIRTTIFDCFYYGQTLYNAPTHTIALNVSLQVVNLLTSPYFTKGYIMQCSNDTFYSDLSQLGKCNLIFLAKPSPSSFHSLFFKK